MHKGIKAIAIGMTGLIFTLGAHAGSRGGYLPDLLRDTDFFNHAGSRGGYLPDPLRDTDFFNDGVTEPEKVRLGRFLYFDKILSGNKNISCATCHHVLTGTGDGLALPVGEGGRGLGVVRDTGTGGDAIEERVPRNAPPVFNLGAKDFTVMFHDGRLVADDEHVSGFQNPAGDNLPLGLDNALAAQAMFPVTSGAEMAGQPGENPIADAAAAANLAGPGGVWEQIAERVQSIDEYVTLFKAAYPGINEASDITMVDIANAIATYEATAFRADNSPFDKYLRGNRRAMSPSAKRGMRIFYQRNSCSSCHSGALQTDLQFYSIAMPQIGPGKGDGLGGHDDFGRERVTNDPNDRYKFRTPSLRNVALTGPWGHSGAYDSLRAVVEHHFDPVDSLFAYDISQARLPRRNDLEGIDDVILRDRTTKNDIAASTDISLPRMTRRMLNDLMAFLHALTDEASFNLRTEAPSRVPSGLPLAD